MFGTWLLSSFNSMRIIQYKSLVASRLRIQGAGLTITRPMMEKANYAQKGGRSKAAKHKTRSLSLHVVAAFSFYNICGKDKRRTVLIQNQSLMSLPLPMCPLSNLSVEKYLQTIINLIKPAFWWKSLQHDYIWDLYL